MVAGDKLFLGRRQVLVMGVLKVFNLVEICCDGKKHYVDMDSLATTPDRSVSIPIKYFGPRETLSVEGYVYCI